MGVHIMDNRIESMPPIAIILPRREVYQKAGAGAVSLCIHDVAANSRYRDNTLVFGEPVDIPLQPPRFVPVTPSPWVFMRRAKRYLGGVIKALREHQAALIEVHNRPIYVDALKKAFPHTPLLLYLHNDPRTMRGLKESGQRRRILERVAAVVCVSDFIRRCMLDGLERHPMGDKVKVVQNGVDTSAIRPVTDGTRRKEIIFVGRLIPEKGGLLFAQTANAVRRLIPDWRFILIGAGQHFSHGPVRDYERRVLAEMANLGEQGKITGYMPRDDVLKCMSHCAAVIVPSTWEEPFCLVAVEAMSAGCAVIASRRGALPDVIGDGGLLFSPDNPQSLEKCIRTLTGDPLTMERYQHAARERAVKFLDIRRCAARLDDVRDELLQMGEETG